MDSKQPIHGLYISSGVLAARNIATLHECAELLHLDASDYHSNPKHPYYSITDHVAIRNAMRIGAIPVSRRSLIDICRLYFPRKTLSDYGYRYTTKPDISTNPETTNSYESAAKNIKPSVRVQK